MRSESGSNLPLDVLRAELNPAHGKAGVEYLYDYSQEGDRRWANLTSYLEFMQSIQPDTLLIGEAPGYRGTSVTGVPFLSEGMIKHRAENDLVLPLTNYAQSAHYLSESGYEATSKIMWEVLDSSPIGKLPLLWAVFPNHPHVLGDVKTNRKPTKKEIALYGGVLALLLETYPIKQIVAIGNVAHATIATNTDFPIIKLRHPARGGANKFRDGFKAFLETTYGNGV